MNSDDDVWKVLENELTKAFLTIKQLTNDKLFLLDVLTTFLTQILKNGLQIELNEFQIEIGTM